jgi:hypothetical protein
MFMSHGTTLFLKISFIWSIFVYLWMTWPIFFTSEWIDQYFLPANDLTNIFYQWMTWSLFVYLWMTWRIFFTCELIDQYFLPVNDLITICLPVNDLTNTFYQWMTWSLFVYLSMTWPIFFTCEWIDQYFYLWMTWLTFDTSSSGTWYLMQTWDSNPQLFFKKGALAWQGSEHGIF